MVRSTAGAPGSAWKAAVPNRRNLFEVGAVNALPPIVKFLVLLESG